MFYKAEEHHGLPFNPLKAIVAPRPIGWISTLSEDGVPNLAPYSFFNAVCDTPPILMFSSGGMKDSAFNVSQTGEFTFNYVSRSMKDQMNITSATVDSGVNEFETSGLSMVAGDTVACPRVRGVAAALECKLLEIVNPTTLDGTKAPYFLVLGQVTGVYIDDSMITESGRFDTIKADPILRSGYQDYVCLDELFELVRPQ
ncbi:MAG: flavin reductase family protein [Rhizobiaceae bacterium]